MDSPLPGVPGRAYVENMGVQRLVTAEELERMGEQDFGFELVRGQLVPVTPPGGEHGLLTVFLTGELQQFARARGLGRVYSESGYVLTRNPDTVRGPDVSFVCIARPAGIKGPLGFITGAPDLAIEIRSPDNTLAALAEKASDYLEAGGRLVWVVDPPSRTVRVYRPGQPVQVLSGKATLDGEDALPGFKLPLTRLFAELD